MASKGASAKWMRAPCTSGYIPLHIAAFGCSAGGGETSTNEGTVTRELERHLVVEVMPADALAPVLAGERAGVQFPLGGDLAQYKDWTLVSHTFEVQADGTAIFTAIFETIAVTAPLD